MKAVKVETESAKACFLGSDVERTVNLEINPLEKEKGKFTCCGMVRQDR